MKQEQISTYAFRLKPGDDLKEGIEKTVHKNQVNAGWVVACVGSLTEYNVRFANQPTGTLGTGHFEIVSLAGIVSIS